MQHLVKQDVLDRIPRYARMIENPADHDGIMSWIVVSEAAAGVVTAPCQLRTSHQPVEESAIEVIEDFFQMVMTTAGRVNVFASAHLANKPRLGRNVMTGNVAPVAGAVDTIDRLAIELGEQDMGNGSQHGFRSAFKQIGDADVEFSLAQSDRVVNGDEGIKTNVQWRRRRARAKIAVCCMKDFGKLRRHDKKG